jgi:hypothetical protein
LGNKIAFNLIINNKDLLKLYCKELLENLFDSVYYFNQIDDLSEFNTNAKNEHFSLWDLEREFNRTQYRQLQSINLGNYNLAQISHQQIEDKIIAKLNSNHITYNQNVPIRNLKNEYISEGLDLKFIFDFEIENSLVEIKIFERISNVDIQNLLIKARLVRYEKETGFLRIRERLKKMILIVNGKIDGPSYDKNRFIKMLYGAGWHVYPVSILDQDPNSWLM